MAIPSIFVCYYVSKEVHSDYWFAMRLIHDLRASGAKVVTAEMEAPMLVLWQILNQELPECQWFILVQTPEALRSPKIQWMVNTSLNLVAQQRIQGVLRVIAAPCKSQEVPLAWAKADAFDATQDAQNALTGLLLKLDLKPATAHTAQRSDVSMAPFPLSPPPSFVHKKPAAPPSRSTFPPALLGRWLSRAARLVLLAAVLLVVISSVLGSFLLFSRSHTPAITSQIVGHAYFVSSGQTNSNSNEGISDQLQIDLQGIASPAPGNSFYGWLLSDINHVTVAPMFLGRLVVKQGKINMLFPGDQKHTNLLNGMSCLLITEGSATSTPRGPSPDQRTWRYYAQVPEKVNSTDMMHASMLDHLRHLLSNDPEQQAVGIYGGLNMGLLENTRKILEWANAARGDWDRQDAALLHRHFVRILDYLDGTSSVQKDVPPGTPVFADPRLGRIPLLAPGYTSLMGMHLKGLVSAPGATAEQRQSAAAIDRALDRVKGWLEQVRMDAKQLVLLTDEQLTQASALHLLDDMVAWANYAYVGKFDPTAPGNMLPGVVWLHTQVQLLASLTVEKYGTSND